MNETTGRPTLNRVALPNDFSNDLPIFKILGNEIPEKLQSPEGKKTIAKIGFFAVLGAVGYALLKAMPTLISFATSSIILVGCSIILLTLILLYPKIVNLLYTWGKVLLFQGEKAIARRYGIETLELSLQEVKQAQREVRDNITKVEGVQINMAVEAENQNKEAFLKFEQVKNLTAEAGRLQKDGDKLVAEGKVEQGKNLLRQAQQTRTAAITRKSEGEASQNLARTFAQYGNQFAKALEILKDNESGVKIYADLLQSSITIVRKKLEATGKMNAATEGLADVFNIKNKWQFQYAMDAVQETISNNIAGIRRNLEFLKESRIDNLSNQTSQEDLELFVQGLGKGQMQKMNVQEITSAYHNLSDDEKADKSFNLF